MTNFSHRMAADHMADDGNLVGFLTGAVVILAAVLLLASQIAMA